MKSILHDKRDGTCYLCKHFYDDFSRKYTQEHHVIFGRANRRLSEKYGLKVYLCIYHHTEGPHAVHNNARNAKILKAIAQEEFEKRFPELEFKTIFGKNHKGELIQEWQQDQEKTVEDGFMVLEDPVPPLDW